MGGQKSSSAIDYKIWGVIQYRVYQTKIKDLDDVECHLIGV